MDKDLVDKYFATIKGMTFQQMDDLWKSDDSQLDTFITTSGLVYRKTKRTPEPETPFSVSPSARPPIFLRRHARQAASSDAAETTPLIQPGRLLHHEAATHEHSSQQGGRTQGATASDAIMIDSDDDDDESVQ
jgi:hypothetical protein